jgi:hypothetical protein
MPHCARPDLDLFSVFHSHPTPRILFLLLLLAPYRLPLAGSLPQPQIYRTIIDDVIASVQVDFEEYGMEEEVLNNLQAVREARIASGLWIPPPLPS